MPCTPFPSLDVPMPGQLHRSAPGRVLLDAEEAGLQEVPRNGQHILPRAEKGGQECVNEGVSSVFAYTVSQKPVSAVLMTNDELSILSLIMNT